MRQRGRRRRGRHGRPTRPRAVARWWASRRVRVTRRCHGGGCGAQAVRSLGARREPAPRSREGEHRRRTTTARAATATSAWKVGTMSGCGTVTGRRGGKQRGEAAWWWQGAQGARSLGARREPVPSSREDEHRRRAATARAATATSTRKVGTISGCGAGCEHRRSRAEG